LINGSDPATGWGQGGPAWQANKRSIDPGKNASDLVRN